MMITPHPQYWATTEFVPWLVSREACLFGFPPYTVQKLEQKSAAHQNRFLEDPGYAVEWKRRFEQAAASFQKHGHP